MNDPTVIATDGRRRPLPVRVERLINVGFTGRDEAAVQAHVEELEAEGVSPPDRIPSMYPKPRHALTSSSSVQVPSPHTSGEAEFILLAGPEAVYVTVGSDHTDRELETQNVALSKAVCPNVASNSFWRLSDVRDHWDELELRSWTGLPDDPSLYQEASVAEIRRPTDLLSLLDERMTGPRRGTALFSGSVSTVSGDLRKEPYFEAELYDPVLDRSLSVDYTVDVLG